MQSEAIRGNPRPSEAIKGHQGRHRSECELARPEIGLRGDQRWMGQLLVEGVELGGGDRDFVLAAEAPARQVVTGLERRAERRVHELVATRLWGEEGEGGAPW